MADDEMDTLKQMGEAESKGDIYAAEARRYAERYRELTRRASRYETSARAYEKSQKRFGEEKALFSETFSKYIKKAPRKARGKGYTFAMAREPVKDDRALGKLFKRYTGETKQLQTKGAALKTEYTGLTKERQELLTSLPAVKASYEKPAGKASSKYSMVGLLGKEFGGELTSAYKVYDIEKGQTRLLSDFELGAANIDPVTGQVRGVLAKGITDTSDKSKYVPPEIYGYPDWEKKITYVDEGGRPVSYDPNIKPLTTTQKAESFLNVALSKIDLKGQEIKKGLGTLKDEMGGISGFLKPTSDIKRKVGIIQTTPTPLSKWAEKKALESKTLYSDYARVKPDVPLDYKPPSDWFPTAPPRAK